MVLTKNYNNLRYFRIKIKVTKLKKKMNMKETTIRHVLTNRQSTLETL